MEAVRPRPQDEGNESRTADQSNISQKPPKLASKPLLKAGQLQSIFKSFKTKTTTKLHISKNDKKSDTTEEQAQTITSPTPAVKQNSLTDPFASGNTYTGTKHPISLRPSNAERYGQSSHATRNIYSHGSSCDDHKRRVLGFSTEEYNQYVWQPQRVGRGTYEVERYR